jgi:hypothetical protein
MNTDSTSFETDTGVEYTPHSMMHKAVVQMDPTALLKPSDLDRKCVRDIEAEFSTTNRFYPQTTI